MTTAVNTKPELISSYEQLRAIAESKPKMTRTYAVTKEIAMANFERIRLMDWHRMRAMTYPEMEELAAFLELPVADVVANEPHVEDRACLNCGRKLTFTDLVNAAVSSSNHHKHFLAEALSGRMGHFITIDGTDDNSHAMKCVACGERDIKRKSTDGASPTPTPCYANGCGGGGPGYAHWPM